MSTKTEITVPEGSHEILLKRTYDAPKALVLRAYTDPEMIPRWWGPRQYETVVDRLEPRKGGVWRFLQKGDDGSEHAFNGVYHQVTPDGQIATFEYEPMAGHVLMQTLALEEVDGRTTVTEKLVFQSVEDRDGMVAAGMEWGARESDERLAELLQSLVATA
jgi:uncharacterized protein YndB with AHSA1/START domain